MLTEREIGELIKSPKMIKERVPARGYKQESGHQRCDLKLESIVEKEKCFQCLFAKTVYMWKIFSIGLRYKPRIKH